MRNINDLRNSLLDNFEKLKNDELHIARAKELANTAGKIINSLKVEMEYNKIRNNNKVIPFLEVE